MILVINNCNFILFIIRFKTYIYNYFIEIKTNLLLSFVTSKRVSPDIDTDVTRHKKARTKYFDI